MKKRLFTIIMSFIMVVSLVPISAFAAEAEGFPVPLEENYGMLPQNVDAISSVPSGSLPARQEVISQWMATNSEAEAASISKDEVVARAATWTEISDFYYYAQEKSTSCGAAAVKMALKGLTGTTYAESTVRTGCKWVDGVGTYMDNCTAYLNSVQDLYNYDDKYSVLKSLFNSNMYNAVNNGAPPIVGIAATEEDGWFYNTSGHALTIYAILSDKSKYAIADPWGGYAGNDDWKWYTKTDSVMFAAYDWNQGYIA